jgi:hypothetical protein
MGAILMVQNSVNLGRGKPGPEDEWRIPALPEKATAGSGVAEEAAAEPPPASNRSSFMRRLTRRA